MEIIRYNKDYETLLFDLLEDEGDDWSEYHGVQGKENYIKALDSSITYIACADGIVCGYVRCREDNGFGVYVYDLLVKKAYRGNWIGKTLIDRVCRDFHNQTVYVNSDADPYYEKLGYSKEGSIFKAKL